MDTVRVRGGSMLGVRFGLVLWCSLTMVAGGCDRVSVPPILGGDDAVPEKPGTSGRKPAGEIAVDRSIVPGIAGEPDVRVRLRDATTTAKLGVAGGGVTEVFVAPVDGSKPLASLRAPIIVSLTSDGWMFTDAAATHTHYPRTVDIDVAPQRDMLSARTDGSAPPAAGTLAREAASAGLAPKLTLDGGKFSGKLRFTPRPDVTPRMYDVIESVGVEEYLKGVVSAEMFPNWPSTAFQVQAVCARSYALHQRHLARTQNLRFDVESSVKDQAYKGADGSFNAAQAVKETEGVVLTWNGQVLRTYYSSASGGRPASARDTWPTTYGYEYNLAGPIQAAIRTEELGKESPFFRWQTARTRQELISRFKEWGRVNGHPIQTITDINSITCTNTNVAGRPTMFRVNGQAGSTYTLSAESLRFACNQDYAGATKITRENRVNSGDMECSILGDVVTIKGRGFGHGVGMDQWAVKELADRGEPWRDIVTRFYPGAKLERAY